MSEFKVEEKDGEQVLTLVGEALTAPNLPLPPPNIPRKNKGNFLNPKDKEISFKSGLGWIVASVLGSILLSLFVLGVIRF